MQLQLMWPSNPLCKSSSFSSSRTLSRSPKWAPIKSTPSNNSPPSSKNIGPTKRPLPYHLRGCPTTLPLHHLRGCRKKQPSTYRRKKRPILYRSPAPPKIKVALFRGWIRTLNTATPLIIIRGSRNKPAVASLYPLIGPTTSLIQSLGPQWNIGTWSKSPSTKFHRPLILPTNLAD